MTLAGLGLVFLYGLSMPFGDEWAWVGQTTSTQPVTWSWLWSLHNEHRMFLPRFDLSGHRQVDGPQFRAGAYFNIMLLAGTAWLMMVAARRGRGRALWCDAVFPLAMLQAGQITNLIWGFELNSWSPSAVPRRCCR